MNNAEQVQDVYERRGFVLRDVALIQGSSVLQFVESLPMDVLATVLFYNTLDIKRERHMGPAAQRRCVLDDTFSPFVFNAHKPHVVRVHVKCSSRHDDCVLSCGRPQSKCFSARPHRTGQGSRTSTTVKHCGAVGCPVNLFLDATHRSRCACDPSVVHHYGHFQCLWEGVFLFTGPSLECVRFFDGPNNGRAPHVATRRSQLMRRVPRSLKDNFDNVTEFGVVPGKFMEVSAGSMLSSTHVGVLSQTVHPRQLGNRKHFLKKRKLENVLVPTNNPVNRSASALAAAPITHHLPARTSH
jgi:hypothetical protein